MKKISKGKICDETYKQLRAEWYEMNIYTQLEIEELKIEISMYLGDLETALIVMSVPCQSLWEKTG
jgi:hypothetical protein